MWPRQRPAAAGATGATGGDSPLGEASTDYPHLLNKPRVSYIESVWNASNYEVTVQVDVDGPDPIKSVGLWIQPTDDSESFDYLELQPVGGTTWSGSTYELVPLPPGEYVIDSIEMEDGDPFDGGQVRSGWYIINHLTSSKYYMVDQRLMDYSEPEPGFVEYNVGMSNIPITHFTLPRN